MREKLKVLMIGGTGIISTDCTILAAQKEEIDLHLLNRGRNPNFLPPGIKTIQADINSVEETEKKLRGMNFDVVCDFISFDIDQLNSRMELFRGHCGQYIFISSVAAYRERAASAPLPRTEAESETGCTTWSYGYNKSLCERRLIEECAATGMKYTIVRPSYTYNNIRFFNPYTINHWESWTIAKRMLEGKPIVLHDDGGALCTVTHTTDFAKAFVGLMGNPEAMNEDFHITSREYHTWKQIAQIQAEVLGVELKFCFVPAEKLCLELNWNAAEKIRHTVNHACFDSSKVAKTVREFQCTIPFREGIGRTVEFYLEHPEFQKVNEWWNNAFDRISNQYGAAK